MYQAQNKTLSLIQNLTLKQLKKKYNSVTLQFPLKHMLIECSVLNFINVLLLYNEPYNNLSLSDGNLSQNEVAKNANVLTQISNK